MSNLDLEAVRRLPLAALVLCLSACASGGASPPPAPGPVIPPQVAYRIDDHRYFEITPWPDGECADKMLYFVDTVKGIRSQAVKWDNVMTQAKFIIDAANDQYLVAPVTRGNTNCSSGGGACGGDKMPYSSDGGRTWKRVWSPGTTYDLMVSGAKAYQSHRIQTVHTDGLDLTLSKPESTDWKTVRGFVFKPRIAPMDTEVRCSAKPEGSQR
jgi:hypothetical protein